MTYKSVVRKLSVSTLGAVMMMGSSFTGAVTAAGETKLSATASASTYDTRCTCGPAQAVDGSLSTRWSGDGNGAWLKLDLGSTKTVAFVKMAFHNGSSRTSNFDIQTSTDNTNWSTRLSNVNSAQNNNLQTFDFTDVSARYVRIVGHGNSVNTWNSYNEVEVWGAGSSTGGGGGGTGTLDPSKAPSGNFDLTKWKITLPNASEVQPSTLSNGYTHSEWFYTDPVTGGMVFMSPNLASTTTNSTYPRSELREMLNPSAGTTSLGNNWVTSTSSSSTKSQAGGVDGTMKATLTVDRVSISGDSSKLGRVVVGQIHGPETEPIRLYFHKRPSDSKGAIYFGTDDLSNKNTYVNILGGPSNLNPSNGIALGQKWSYEIKVVGLQMTVKVTPEGGSTTTVNYTLPSGYNDKYLYYKAGVYNQNNTDTTSDKSDHVKATFYSLTHVHP
ncbi:polysaccharide lyase family 7 protein [Paenibacillus sp. YYML68]|uniref:polysaccharide lyase family 7 protein n=1 Tax=Paenibacillus sp. YYML68 TaxID=2909250 RepID=UPI002490B4D0|nr:polysaccharide lyase family 7 protein [Paenibacillus sp. YYML68]